MAGVQDYRVNGVGVEMFKMSQPPSNTDELVGSIELRIKAG